MFLFCIFALIYWGLKRGEMFSQYDSLCFEIMMLLVVSFRLLGFSGLTCNRAGLEQFGVRKKIR